MQLARVIGDVVVTVKDTNLSGIKLMVLQPLASDGTAAGRTLVAVDAVGAGVGETVFFVRGKEASFPFHPTEVPADAGIVGIVDHWDLDGNPSGATIGTKNLPETGDRRPETRNRRPKSGD